MSEENSILGCIGIVTLAAGLLAYSAIVDGLVVSTLWNWFAVPLFEVRHLTIGQAIGLSLIVSAFLGYRSPRNTKDDTITEKITAVLLPYVVRPVLLLLMGLIVNWLVF